MSSAIHCELPPFATSRTTTNRGIHEIWYFTSGHGLVWRGDGSVSQEVDVEAGSSITIPPDVMFQYRNTGGTPLVFLCFVAPAFPGPEANQIVQGADPLGPPNLVRSEHLETEPG